MVILIITSKMKTKLLNWSKNTKIATLHTFGAISLIDLSKKILRRKLEDGTINLEFTLCGLTKRSQVKIIVGLMKKYCNYRKILNKGQQVKLRLMILKQFLILSNLKAGFHKMVLMSNCKMMEQAIAKITIGLLNLMDKSLYLIAKIIKLLSIILFGYLQQ